MIGMFDMEVFGNFMVCLIMVFSMLFLKVLMMCFSILCECSVCGLYMVVSSLFIVIEGLRWLWILLMVLMSRVILCRVKNLYLSGMMMLCVVVSVLMVRMFSDGW